MVNPSSEVQFTYHHAKFIDYFADDNLCYYGKPRQQTSRRSNHGKASDETQRAILWTITSLNNFSFQKAMRNDFLGVAGFRGNPQVHLIMLARVVQRLDNAIQRINHYPVDSVVCFVNIYPLDSDLSGG